MLFFNRISHKFKAKLIKDTEPGKAYNLWSENYDQQPDNLMLYLDEIIIQELLKSITIRNKKVLDFGCGTGRHWQKLYSESPEELIGADISEGMLDVLKSKYPSATVHHTTDNLLQNISDEYIDTVLSTLTIAHIHNIKEIFTTWNRILKPGGDLIITDFHPDLLNNGGKRVFTIAAKTIRIKNYIHSVSYIEKLAYSNDFDLVYKTEKYINEDVKRFYEKQNALDIYEKYYGYPVIYGLHFKKK